MAKTRREFTPEFKREAVALLESSDRPQMQIAAELGIQPSMLRQWRATLNGAALRPRSEASAGLLPASPVASRPIRPPRSPGSAVSSIGRAWSATS